MNPQEKTKVRPGWAAITKFWNFLKNKNSHAAKSEAKGLVRTSGTDKRCRKKDPREAVHSRPSSDSKSHEW